MGLIIWNNLIFRKLIVEFMDFIVNVLKNRRLNRSTKNPNRVLSSFVFIIS